MGEPLVHFPDHGFVGSFLGPENGTAALFSAERIGYITGDAEGTVLKLREGIFIINKSQIFKPQSTGADWRSVSIEKRKTEGLEHTGSAVVGGTSADANDEMAAALFDGIPDDFTHAKSRGEGGDSALKLVQE